MAFARPVVGARLLGALLATSLAMGAALLLLLGAVALAHHLVGGGTPLPFALGTLALGGACGTVAWWLGRGVRPR